MADQILPKGIRFFNKHEKAPDFVIGTLVVTLSQLTEFFKDNPTLLTDYKGEDQLKIQVLKSKEGNIYGAVDTYKKETAADSVGARHTPDVPDTDGLPF